MTHALIIRGRVIGQKFVPDAPLPAEDGPAELIVFLPETKAPKSGTSIFDLAGKAPVLRTAEDIAAQTREERDNWGEP